MGMAPHHVIETAAQRRHELFLAERLHAAVMVPLACGSVIGVSAVLAARAGFLGESCLLVKDSLLVGLAAGGGAGFAGVFLALTLSLYTSQTWRPGSALAAQLPLLCPSPAPTRRFPFRRP